MCSHLILFCFISADCVVQSHKDRADPGDTVDPGDFVIRTHQPHHTPPTHTRSHPSYGYVSCTPRTTTHTNLTTRAESQCIVATTATLPLTIPSVHSSRLLAISRQCRALLWACALLVPRRPPFGPGVLAALAPPAHIVAF